MLAGEGGELHSNEFYAYDSDDPDGKWLVTVEGNGICPVREWRIHSCEGFRIHWRIEDHLGNGPTRQTYCNVRPLKKKLRHIRQLIEDNLAGAEEDTKANE